MLESNVNIKESPRSGSNACNTAQKTSYCHKDKAEIKWSNENVKTKWLRTTDIPPPSVYVHKYWYRDNI